MGLIPVQEDPTCFAATLMSLHHNYWSLCALEPVLATKNSPCWPQLEKAHVQQWRPSAAKKLKKIKLKKNSMWPRYTLGSGEQWPLNGSPNHYTVLHYNCFVKEHVKMMRSWCRSIYATVSGGEGRGCCIVVTATKGKTCSTRGREESESEDMLFQNLKLLSGQPSSPTGWADSSCSSHPTPTVLPTCLLPPVSPTYGDQLEVLC